MIQCVASWLLHNIVMWKVKGAWPDWNTPHTGILLRALHSSTTQINMVFLRCRCQCWWIKGECERAHLLASGGTRLVQRAQSDRVLRNVFSCCWATCFPLISSPAKKKKSERKKKNKTLQKRWCKDAWDDIVEVKNLLGRPQRYSPGSWCVRLVVVVGVGGCVLKQVMEFSGVCSGFKEQPSERIMSYFNEWEGLRYGCHGNPLTHPAPPSPILPAFLPLPLPSPRIHSKPHRWVVLRQVRWLMNIYAVGFHSSLPLDPPPPLQGGAAFVLHGKAAASSLLSLRLICLALASCVCRCVCTGVYLTSK